ncbi:MAG: hypothetical protein H3C34_10185 [Caldilineaceae bacterium]|nr:hypothetical protein [Caldilineaceae bacterium]
MSRHIPMRRAQRMWAFMLACLAAILLSTPLYAQEEPAEVVPAEVMPPPRLISPFDGEMTTVANYPPLAMPTLRWEAIPDATVYHIQISDSPGFSTMLADTDVYAATYTPSSVWSDDTYYWRVRAGSRSKLGVLFWGPYSEIRQLTKNWSNDANASPVLLSPAEGAVRSAYQHDDFSWTAVQGAAGYKFEIATDANFSNIVYTAETLKSAHTPTKRLASNVYYWRVTPFAYYIVATLRTYGTPSKIQSFTYAWNTPPTVLDPPATVNGQPPELHFAPRFRWTAVEAAAQYLLEISTDAGFSSVTSYTTRNTDFTPTAALSNDQEYFWRVKAIDAEGNSTAWSEVRRFRVKWNFGPTLLTPANNQINAAYPFFSWEPVPGAEQYHIQISDGNKLVADEKIYNVTTYAYPGPWQNLAHNRDYYWQVRAIDAQGNFTPWSVTRSFQYAPSTFPNLIYPHYYYTPNTVDLPIHGDNTIAWPVFVWDAAHAFEGNTVELPDPDYYQLDVDDDPAFGSPNFTIQTTGLAAAPTQAHPFAGLTNGTVYYWRVRAYRNSLQIGVDVVWRMRYDGTVNQLPTSSAITPIHPASGMEAVETPPVLGWLPVTGAANYRVQISLSPDFTQVIDEAVPLYVNYVPWQGKPTRMESGTYWWRVRAESAPGVALGNWSETRRFNLSRDVIQSNPNDMVPPPKASSILSTTATYNPTFTYLATSAVATGNDYELGNLHVLVDRANYNASRNWVIAFGVSPATSGPVRYGIYVDTDHVQNSGATTDPLGEQISVNSYHRPEFVLYVTRNGSTVDPTTVTFHRWENASWQPQQTLAFISGDAWFAQDSNAVQLLVPYTAFGSADDDFSGSLAVAVFSTDTTSTTDGMRDSIPQQGTIYGNLTQIDKPAFTSDMLMPLYPFDTPLSNPIIFYDMPPLRWRMPTYDSVDGYQIQVARDARFSDVVETWETYESQTSPYFGFLPSTFQSENEYGDNESYYWRVRIRHEKFELTGAFDYGPWSPAMRFKLSSRPVGNPTLSTGVAAFMTPTFTWDRVQGASGYKIQIDNDANFSSPIVDEGTDATSFTPVEGGLNDVLLAGSQYYWRVAMRRSKAVVGQWSPTQTFVKTSVAPTPILPTQNMTVTGQPTFQWSVVLTPTDTPRLATPQYHLQVDDDPTFGSPLINISTQSTSFTPVKGKTLADGLWYWRVAIQDARGKDGPFSAPVTFGKQYLLPQLIFPASGGAASGIPPFSWGSVPGAAYYELKIANNDSFTGATRVTTPNTTFTPTSNLKYGRYYWRVQMFDQDKNSGPVIARYFDFGYVIMLPVVQMAGQ